MPRGIPITLRDVERAADHYALWGSWSAAAAHIGVSYNGLLNALKDFPEERVEWEEKFRNSIRSLKVETARDPKNPNQWKAIDRLSAEHLPESRDVLVRRQIELTGPGGSPLEVKVEHDYGSLLAGLEQIGLIRRPVAAVDAADPEPERPALLPALPD